MPTEIQKNYLANISESAKDQIIIFMLNSYNESNKENKVKSVGYTFDWLNSQIKEFNRMYKYTE